MSDVKVILGSIRTKRYRHRHYCLAARFKSYLLVDITQGGMHQNLGIKSFDRLAP